MTGEVRECVPEVEVAGNFIVESLKIMDAGEYPSRISSFFVKRLWESEVEEYFVNFVVINHCMKFPGKRD